jgi:hypothetical protein
MARWPTQARPRIPGGDFQREGRCRAREAKSQESRVKSQESRVKSQESRVESQESDGAELLTQRRIASSPGPH